MRVAATPLLIRPGVMTRAPTPGMMQRPPICQRAARVPAPELTTADGYLQGATSTSPSATAPSRGILLPTPGVTCRIWFRHAITSQGQLLANPSTPLPAIRRRVLLPMTTSSTLKPPAPQQHPHLRQRLLRQNRV